MALQLNGAEWLLVSAVDRAQISCTFDGSGKRGTAWVPVYCGSMVCWGFVVALGDSKTRWWMPLGLGCWCRGYIAYKINFLHSWWEVQEEGVREEITEEFESNVLRFKGMWLFFSVLYWSQGWDVEAFITNECVLRHIPRETTELSRLRPVPHSAFNVFRPT